MSKEMLIYLSLWQQQELKIASSTNHVPKTLIHFFIIKSGAGSNFVVVVPSILVYYILETRT